MVVPVVELRPARQQEAVLVAVAVRKHNVRPLCHDSLCALLVVSSEQNRTSISHRVGKL
jgi:hypothetical protein